jgi:glycosyltransferase involved in cell wall biosynthesis
MDHSPYVTEFGSHSGEGAAVKAEASDENLRICCPLPGIPPGLKMTGSAADDRNALKHLALLGVKVDVILPEGNTLMEHVGHGRGLTTRAVRIPLRPPLARHVARIFRFSSAVRSQYRECRFDLLRVHSFFSSCLEVLYMKATYKLPVPFVAHFYHLDANPWRNLIVGNALAHCDALVTISQASKQQVMTSFGIASSKVHVIYLGIEQRFSPAARSSELLRSLRCDPEEKILLFLGSLEPRKNPLFLLDILRDVLAANAKRKVKLIIAGVGPLLATIKRKVIQQGLESNVVLTGHIPEDLKPAYYNLADVFVFPSSLEGFGLVLGEAMSCGKPVVALDTSAVAEVVEDGVTGFLASPGDKEELVRKTLLLLDHKDLSFQMGTRGRERVDRLFRWERIAKETFNFYQETVKQFRSGG